eukprot:3139570-Pleurochrysis_carterae.AAC.1
MAWDRRYRREWQRGENGFGSSAEREKEQMKHGMNLRDKRRERVEARAKEVRRGIDERQKE